MKKRFKVWGGPAGADWQQKLSRSTVVSRIDEDLPPSATKRKPWFVGLTQSPDRLTAVGGVRDIPKGKTLLLSEDEALAFVRYLLDGGGLIVDPDTREILNEDQVVWDAAARTRKRSRKRR